MNEANENKEQKSAKCIRIKRGEEFRPYVMDKFDGTDYFADVYRTAADCVKDIVSATEAFQEKKCRENSEYDRYLNNIVAFCGERGQGKTGALLTFRKILSGYNHEKDDEGAIMKPCGNSQFTMLDVIDPSMFDDDCNILQVIIARMFKKFRDECEKKNKDNDSYIDQRNVMEKFLKVFGFINQMMKPNKAEKSNFYDDSADALIDISDAVNLRISLHDLVEKYLEFMNSFKGTNFLVIPIDDIDVNIEFAYKMAEQLRKYLIVPNVVILMALKVEQLAGAVVNHYEKKYESKNDRNKYEFIKMAERYIEKLLPNGRKIYLPEIRIDAQSDEQTLEIIYEDKENGDKHFRNGLQETVLNYIYKKTTLAFCKPQNGIHPLVPGTLRELTGLFAVLGHMKEIENHFIWNIETDDKQRKVVETNLMAFENYFINTWVPSKLNEGNADTIRELFNTNDFEKHRFIITKIYDMLYNHTYFSLKVAYQNKDSQKPLPSINYDIIQDEVKEYGTRTANPLLYSLGDVMDATTRLLEIINDEETEKFVCAIRVLYTCSMHKLVFNSVVSFDKKNFEDKIANAYDYKPNSIYKFVGGDIFGKQLSETLRKELKNRNTSRTNYEVLNLTGLTPDQKRMSENDILTTKLRREII
ncbi:MAG: hypothetical protein ABF449_09435, partial [Ethanoligenens sp.]